ncbi:MAG: patatin-like phospholipase family protein [Bacteroidetes bacterium]|uniref:Patatin-like phospholipase family protein n=1 Tax=Candidatus Caccoplasma merdipullorum TaxID=2840718 RepID=A0A9D9E3K3_9BACT|nr:patatin-like phospholipase family protein [Candidatus Caccoplasma merdipullorum]
MRRILPYLFSLLIFTGAKAESVGLVLSGGGAKGIAHIGVIQALEDNGIPIDYVTGTSMGAIVGAMYAMGLTPSEMMEIIKSPDFESWSKGEISKKQIFYFRRPDPSPQFVSFDLSLNERDKRFTTHLLPTNLINPIPMNVGFLYLFSPATGQCRGNFDNLFVPFRSVASDVYNKRAVVFSRGDLGDAVRASMTFPFVFKPIEIDSILLYDGGIYNNFPIDVMQEDFNPDFIIGCKVASNPGKPKEGDLMAQLDAMVMQKTDYSVPEDKGVLISFNLSGQVGLLDFPKADMIYRIGYEKGLQYADSIKSRISRRVTPESRQLKRMQYRSRTPEVKFDKVTVNGGTHSQQTYIRKQFEAVQDSLGHIDMNGFDIAYYKLVSDSKISDLIPHGVYNDTTGLYTLVLDAKIKDNISFGFGAYISSGNTNQIYLDAKYRTLSLYSLDLDLNGYLGRSYNSAMFSAKLELPWKIPMYLKMYGCFSKKKYYESEKLFIQTESPTFITNQEAYVKLRLGLPFLNSSKTEITVGYGYLTDAYYPSNYLDFTTTKQDKSNYSLFMGSVKFESNTLNSIMYPIRGSRITISGEFVLGKETYIQESIVGNRYSDNHSWLQLNAGAEYYLTPIKKFSLGFVGDMVISSKSFFATYTSTIVQAPAFTPTPHSKTVFNEAFRANQYVAGGIVPVWNIVNNLQLRGEFYCFVPFFEIKQDMNGLPYYGKFMDSVKYMGEVSLVYNLPFAAISMFSNYYSYPARNWNFGLALGVLLYNPRFLE